MEHYSSYEQPTGFHAQSHFAQTSPPCYYPPPPQYSPMPYHFGHPGYNPCPSYYGGCGAPSVAPQSSRPDQAPRLVPPHPAPHRPAPHRLAPPHPAPDTAVSHRGVFLVQRTCDNNHTYWEPAGTECDCAKCLALEVRASAQPVQATAQPVPASAQPVQATAQPVQATAQQVQASAQPVQVTAQLIPPAEPKKPAPPKTRKRAPSPPRAGRRDAPSPPRKRAKKRSHQRLDEAELARRLDQMKRQAVKRGGVCLTKKLENGMMPAIFQCGRGHCWPAVYSHIIPGPSNKTGTWCRTCREEETVARQAAASLSHATRAPPQAARAPEDDTDASEYSSLVDIEWVESESTDYEPR